MKLTIIQIKPITKWSDLALSLQLEIYQNMLKTCTAAEIIHITGMTSTEHTNLESDFMSAMASPVNEDELYQKVDAEFYQGLKDYDDPPSYSAVMEKHMDDFVRSGHLYHPYEYEIQRAQGYLRERDLDESLAGYWWPEQQHSLFVEDEDEVQEPEHRADTQTRTASGRELHVSSKELQEATGSSLSTLAAKLPTTVRAQHRHTSQTRAPLSDLQVRAGTDRPVDTTIATHVDCTALQIIEGSVRPSESLHVGAEDLLIDTPTASSHGHPASEFVTPERTLSQRELGFIQEPPTTAIINAESRVPFDRRRKASNELVNDKENFGFAVAERLPAVGPVPAPFARKRRAIDRSPPIESAAPSENIFSMSKNVEPDSLQNARPTFMPVIPFDDGQQYNISDGSGGPKLDLGQIAHREASTPPKQVSRPGLSSPHFPARPKKSKARASSPPELMTCSPQSSTSKKNSSFLSALTNDSFDQSLDQPRHKSRALSVQERLQRAQFELPDSPSQALREALLESLPEDHVLTAPQTPAVVPKILLRVNALVNGSGSQSRQPNIDSPPQSSPLTPGGISDEQAVPTPCKPKAAPSKPRSRKKVPAASDSLPFVSNLVDAPESANTAPKATSKLQTSSSKPASSIKSAAKSKRGLVAKLAKTVVRQEKEAPTTQIDSVQAPTSIKETATAQAPESTKKTATAQAPKSTKKTAAVSATSTPNDVLAPPTQKKRIGAKRTAATATPTVNDSSEGQSEGQASEPTSGTASSSAKKRADAGRVRGPYKKTRERMAREEEERKKAAEAAKATDKDATVVATSNGENQADSGLPITTNGDTPEKMTEEPEKVVGVTEAPAT